MNCRQRSGSRLATAASEQFVALRMACQFFRAMFAVPKIPQRQMVFCIAMFTLQSYPPSFTPAYSTKCRFLVQTQGTSTLVKKAVNSVAALAHLEALLGVGARVPSAHRYTRLQAFTAREARGTEEVFAPAVFVTAKSPGKNHLPSPSRRANGYYPAWTGSGNTLDSTSAWTAGYLATELDCVGRWVGSTRICVSESRGGH